MDKKITIGKLKELLSDGHCIVVHVYAPAERYENRYYKLSVDEYKFADEEILGYEFIADDYVSNLNVIINKPVDFTDVTITAHFVDGTTFRISQPVHLQLELVELYDFWPAHIDCRTGEEWKVDEQLTIDESSGGF